MSRRVQKLLRNLAEVSSAVIPERFVGDVDIDRLTEAERAFVRLAFLRDKRSIRGGWPDFLVVDGAGAVLGVEVKLGSDPLSKSQVLMFEALEAHTNLRIFVWNPARPNRLTPWRKYRRWKGESSKQKAIPDGK